MKDPVDSASMRRGSKEYPNPQICPHPESGLLPLRASAVSCTSSDSPSCTLFYPPSNATELPQFVTPTMVCGSPTGDGVIRPIPIIASNPSTGAHVTTDDAAVLLQIPNFDNDEQMFHYVITQLQRALNDCQTAGCESKDVNYIQSKVNILSDMWKNGKVSYPVKSTMVQLSTAIHHRHCAIACELHLSLMSDHVSEVSSWHVGIRLLIEEIEKIDKCLNPSSSCFPVTEVESDGVQPNQTVSAHRSPLERLVEPVPSPGRPPDDVTREGSDLPDVNVGQAATNELELMNVTGQFRVIEDNTCNNSQDATS